MSLSSRSQPHFLYCLPAYMANLLFLVMSMRSAGFLGVDNVHVVVFLMPLFYWTVHRPALMPLWFVFLGGLLIDFAVDAPLGLHAFGFILFCMLLLKVRRIILSQPGFYHFMIYGFAVFVFEVLRWGLVSFLSWTPMPFFPALTGFVVNVVAFIPGMIVLGGLNRLIAGSR